MWWTHWPFFGSNFWTESLKTTISYERADSKHVLNLLIILKNITANGGVFVSGLLGTDFSTGLSFAEHREEEQGGKLVPAISSRQLLL
jgi:hypothetical protein